MAAAAPISVPALLTKLATSIESALEPLPDDINAILPPELGISLLDVKSELLLSYVQNLVFLILLKIRFPHHLGEPSTPDVTDEVVNKLVELRVYLEKGVRPLENRLKYQIDKVLRAADTADRTQADKQGASTASSRPKTKLPKSTTTNTALSGSEEEFSPSDSEASASDSDSDSIDELSYRPNPAAFAQATTAPRSASTTTKQKAATDGIYRPPRITPTSLPTTSSTQFNDRYTSQRAARPQRSSAVDEYISTELSGAPIAEPSIGTTIVSGGRRVKGAAERAREAERAEYEESNFVRLPKESKKVEAQRRRMDRGGFGGEEMRGLGEMGDRVGRVTGKRRGGRETVDGVRGEGFSGGSRGGKRRKVGRR